MHSAFVYNRDNISSYSVSNVMYMSILFSCFTIPSFRKVGVFGCSTLDKLSPSEY